MYIVYNTDNNLEQLSSKYLVLELDTVEINGENVTAYAVVDSANVAIQELSILQNLKELHQNLIKNYRLKNWKYCTDAIDHLQGKFKGELDSFYTELSDRIAELKECTLADDWTGIIKTTKVISE